MPVAFRSQNKVAYKNTATIEWYGDVLIEYIAKYFTKPIDFLFTVNPVDYSQTVKKLSIDFEVLLENFNFLTKAIDFDFEVGTVDYTKSANKIDREEGLI